MLRVSLRNGILHLLRLKITKLIPKCWELIKESGTAFFPVNEISICRRNKPKRAIAKPKPIKAIAVLNSSCWTLYPASNRDAAKGLYCFVQRIAIKRRHSRIGWPNVTMSWTRSSGLSRLPEKIYRYLQTSAIKCHACRWWVHRLLFKVMLSDSELVTQMLWTGRRATSFWIGSMQ